MTSSNSRTSDHAVEPLFLDRWSPRAFAEDAISEETLLSLFEAARWAPSSYNAQPWRFIYATRGSAHWERLFGLLNPFNQSWAGSAAALIIVVSKTTMRPPGASADVPYYSHSFDAGAAWALLALQGAKLGWYAHGMAGFDIPRASVELGIPADYRVEAAIAVGRLGDPASLPEPMRAREMPSGREPVSAFAFEGAFPAA
ncbi:MAG TPA: nitroreductase family protein [Xanthobacteraceae bacterium]|nr:nitroreductase family protein [Xanthobacteraceae bacterium]